MKKKSRAVLISVLTLLMMIPLTTSIVHADELGCPNIDSYSTEGGAVTLNWSRWNYGIETTIEIYCVTTNKKYSTPESRGSYKITGLPGGETIKIKWRAYVNNTTQYTDWQGPLYITVKAGYEVRYYPNGGTSAPEIQEKLPGVTLTLSGKTPTRTGYQFKGWATSSSDANNGKVSYLPNGTYTNDKALKLFAVWEKTSEETVETYKIRYNANGGTGAPSEQTKEYGKTLYLSKDVPTRAGYSFVGWATTSTATTATYQPGGSYTNNKNATFYAVWKEVPLVFTIKYDANGGTGAPTSQQKEQGKAITLRTGIPTRSGYTFLGWATSSTAKKATYQPGDSFTWDNSATLYAVWKSNETDLKDCSINITGGTNFVYDGHSKSLSFTITHNGKTLTKGTDYTVSGNSGTNAGDYKVTITGKGIFTGSIEKSFTIKKADPVLYYENSEITIYEDAQSWNNALVKTSGLSLSFKSSNTSVATINSTGSATMKGVGTTIITATSKETQNYYTKSTSYTLNVLPLKPSAVKKSTIKVKLSYGRATVTWATAKNAKEYKVQYKDKSGWHDYSSVSSAKAIIEGLAPSSKYTFRIKSIRGSASSSYTNSKTVKTANTYNIVYSYNNYEWISDAFSKGVGKANIQYVKKGGTFKIPNDAWYAIKRSDGKYYNKVEKTWMARAEAEAYMGRSGAFTLTSNTLNKKWIKNMPNAYFELVQTMR